MTHIMRELNRIYKQAGVYLIAIGLVILSIYASYLNGRGLGR